LAIPAAAALTYEERTFQSPREPEIKAAAISAVCADRHRYCHVDLFIPGLSSRVIRRVRMGLPVALLTVIRITDLSLSRVRFSLKI